MGITAGIAAAVATTAAAATGAAAKEAQHPQVHPTPHVAHGEGGGPRVAGLLQQMAGAAPVQVLALSEGPPRALGSWP